MGIYKSVCTRCGKERIVHKTWNEKFGDSIIVNTEMICPDSDCQKIVNRDIKKQKDKADAMRQRAQDRVRRRKAPATT